MPKQKWKEWLDDGIVSRSTLDKASEWYSCIATWCLGWSSGNNLENWNKKFQKGEKPYILVFHFCRVTNGGGGGGKGRKWQTGKWLISQLALNWPVTDQTSQRSPGYNNLVHFDDKNSSSTLSLVTFKDKDNSFSLFCCSKCALTQIKTNKSIVSSLTAACFLTFLWLFSFFSHLKLKHFGSKMTTEVAPDSLDFICDFYNHFDISKPRINDTCRPHPKFSKFSRDFKDHQERRRKEFFDNLKKFGTVLGDSVNWFSCFLGKGKGCWTSFGPFWTIVMMKKCQLNRRTIRQSREMLIRAKSVKCKWTEVSNRVGNLETKCIGRILANWSRNNWCCPSGWWKCPKISTPTGIWCAVLGANVPWWLPPKVEPKSTPELVIFSLNSNQFYPAAAHRVAPIKTLWPKAASWIASTWKRNTDSTFSMCSPGMVARSMIVKPNFVSIGYIRILKTKWKSYLPNNQPWMWIDARNNPSAKCLHSRHCRTRIVPGKMFSSTPKDRTAFPPRSVDFCCCCWIFLNYFFSNFF